MITVALRRDPMRFFFDRPAVIKALERGQARAMARSGGFVMRVARRSMRRVKRDRSSKPGAPPFARVGLLRDKLFFAFDDKLRDVVVGPEGFAGSSVPSLHERGGVVRLNNQLVTRVVRSRDASGRFTARRVTQRVTGTLRYDPRPYMAPALEISRDRIAEFWADVAT